MLKMGFGFQLVVSLQNTAKELLLALQICRCLVCVKFVLVAVETMLGSPYKTNVSNSVGVTLGFKREPSAAWVIDLKDS